MLDNSVNSNCARAVHWVSSNVEQRLDAAIFSLGVSIGKPR